MAARKSNRGRRRNRGRFGFLYVLLSFLLILAALVAGSLVFFRVGSIEVVGNDRYSAQEIIDAAKVEHGDNLFRLNTAKISQALISELPYIRSASVSWDLPDGLIVTVTECQAVACISTESGWYLLDSRGKLLEQGGAAFQQQVPKVEGLIPLSPSVGQHMVVSDSEQFRLDALSGLLTAMEKQNLLANLTYLDLNSNSTVIFGYADRFTVETPLSCDFEYKMRAMQFVIEHLEDNETGLIDLTRDDKSFFIPQ